MKPFPRIGAWAVYNGQIGLLWQDDRFNQKTGKRMTRHEFHMVDAAGNTTAVAEVDWNKTRIAKRSEIPAPRIAGLDEATLTALGYVG